MQSTTMFTVGGAVVLSLYKFVLLLFSLSCVINLNAIFESIWARHHCYLHQSVDLASTKQYTIILELCATNASTPSCAASCLVLRSVKPGMRESTTKRRHRGQWNRSQRLANVVPLPSRHLLLADEFQPNIVNKFTKILLQISVNP